ncbi:MAG TPA: hypothetical protein VGS41_18810, partial [Chthonomonadales bacterium]|nr:hypothetical protein [Chthonomonadales bacterium]
EQLININVHAKPVNQLTLNYDMADASGGDDPKNPPLSSQGLDMQWQAAKDFAVTAGVQDRSEDSKPEGNTVNIGLQDGATRAVAVSAKFNEVHDNAKNTKDVADFSIGNGKPIDFGPVKGLTFTAHYGSLNDQRKLQNEAMSGRITWTLFKSSFLVDYNGLTKTPGQTTISRLYSVETDKNPKRWFHASFLYKDRSMLDGTEKLVRRFAADARLSKSTSFAYSYGTLPEDQNGNIIPVTSADIALKQALRIGLSGTLFYKDSQNTSTKILTRSLGLGFEGKTRGGNTLSIAYSLDANGSAVQYDHSDHLHLGFQHEMDADHFLTLSAEIRSHDARNLTDEIQTNLDFRTVF